MRRGPQEDDREQQPRQQRHLARRRDPADQRRERAGGAADDDVLRGPGLQPHGVDEDVEQDRDRQQARRQPVGRDPHQQDREDASPTPKWSAVCAVHAPAGQRPVGGAPHLGVDLGLIPLVERPARAGAERDAQDRGEARARTAASPARRAGRTAPVNTTRLITRGLVSARMSRQSAGSAVGWSSSSAGMARAYRRAGPRRKRREATVQQGAARRRRMIRPHPCRGPRRARSPLRCSPRRRPPATAPQEELVPVALETSHGPDRHRARQGPRAGHDRQLPQICRWQALRRPELLPRDEDGRRRPDPGRRPQRRAQAACPRSRTSRPARPASRMSPGAIVMAHGGPGTARSDFFILLSDQPAFDADGTARRRRRLRGVRQGHRGDGRGAARSSTRRCPRPRARA